MVIRFASPHIDCDSGRETGIFQMAYRLKNSGRLKKDDHKELCGLLAVFEKELAVPTCYKRQIRESLRYKAICWLKNNSCEFTQSLWLMAWFLRERGVALQTIRTRRPGRVLYEDRHQIAAIPPRRVRMKREWI